MKISGHFCQGMAVEHKNIAYLQQLVYDNTGVIIADNKQDMIISRLTALIRDDQFSSIDNLLNHLKSTLCPRLRVKVTDAMMTNETLFFRETHFFQLLRDTLIPQRLKTNGRNQPLTIWSGACSTGQESYSIAITLSEIAGQLAHCKTRIMASDVSEFALSKANSGLFTDFDCTRGLSQPQRQRFFTPAPPKFWQVNDSIRSAVEFRQINLVKTWPHLPLMDIIFLRHVLIYFDEKTKTEVLQKAWQQLKPGGFLIVGIGEAPDRFEPRFKPRILGKCVFYEK